MFARLFLDPLGAARLMIVGSQTKCESRGRSMTALEGITATVMGCAIVFLAARAQASPIDFAPDDIIPLSSFSVETIRSLAPGQLLDELPFAGAANVVPASPLAIHQCREAPTEPSTWLLMLVGLGVSLLGGATMRRRN